MIPVKTFDSTGIAPNGRVYASDLNGIQAAAAGLTDLSQNVSVASLVVGEAGLTISRLGAGEMQAAGGFRSTGILRGLGGVYVGQFTTAQRDAIASGKAPTGILIFNTTSNMFEWNSGTDGARVWKPMGMENKIGLLVNRPAANSVQPGTTYFATDQVTDWISDGTNWIRKGDPAGTVVSWYASTGAIPAGWVAYDGTNIGGSTGIYADLYAHLGNTLTTPDTRGRVEVSRGTHTDVDVIGENEGAAVGSRSIKHNHTATSNATSNASSNAVSNASSAASSYDNISGVGGSGNQAGASAVTGADGEAHWIATNVATNVATSVTTNVSTSVSTTVGTGGLNAPNTPAFIVTLKIAKL